MLEQTLPLKDTLPLQKCVPFQKYHAILQYWASSPALAGWHKCVAKQEVCQFKRASRFRKIKPFQTKFASSPFKKLPSGSVAGALVRVGCWSQKRNHVTDTDCTEGYFIAIALRPKRNPHGDGARCEGVLFSRIPEMFSLLFRVPL